jgi:hypothetical protein
LVIAHRKIATHGSTLLPAFGVLDTGGGSTAGWGETHPRSPPFERATKPVTIVYLLEGPFGGHSSQVQPREDKLSYTLPMRPQELTATRMKAVIWTEGCELQTFELDLLHSVERELTFECLAPSSVLLTGRLLLSDALRKDPHPLAIS